MSGECRKPPHCRCPASQQACRNRLPAPPPQYLSCFFVTCPRQSAQIITTEESGGTLQMQ